MDPATQQALSAVSHVAGALDSTMKAKEDLIEGLGDSIYRTVLGGMLGQDFGAQFFEDPKLKAQMQQRAEEVKQDMKGAAGDVLLPPGMSQNAQMLQNAFSSPTPGMAQPTTGPSYGPVP